MIERALNKGRLTLFRLVIFWTIVLSVLLVAASDLEPVPAITRFIYWALHIGLGLTAVIVVTRWLQSRWLSTLSEWGQLATSSVVAVIVFTPVAIVLDLLIPDSFGPAGHADIQSDARTQGIWGAVIDEIGSAAPTVIAVWLIVHLTYRFINSQAGDDSTPTSKPREEASSAEATRSAPNPKRTSEGLYSKLPPALGTEIVSIRSDANYIHVQTISGKTMFLYSLEKASAELSDSGMLVHRSHWVSFDHVHALKRNGSQTVCVMVDGTTVPVSRRRQQDVVNYFGKDFVRAAVTKTNGAPLNNSEP